MVDRLALPAGAHLSDQVHRKSPGALSRIGLTNTSGEASHRTTYTYEQMSSSTHAQQRPVARVLFAITAQVQRISFFNCLSCLKTFQALYQIPTHCVHDASTTQENSSTLCRLDWKRPRPPRSILHQTPATPTPSIHKKQTTKTMINVGLCVNAHWGSIVVM